MKKSFNSTKPTRVLITLIWGMFFIELTGRLHAINGLEGTFEFACDAPWRIEPHLDADGSVQYGAIPIQISIHDAMHTALDNIFYAEIAFQHVPISLPTSLVSPGKFHSVHIRELAPTESAPRSYDLHSLHEIEMTVGDWAWPANPLGHPHGLCRRWLAEDPEPFRDISRSSEWHASLWYAPQNPTPGTTITLQIDVVLLRDPWPQTDLPLEDLHEAMNNSPLLTLRNYVRVHLAADPLPRFDNRWLYGDFHYHSQGTDNEGEAAYNYRGVVRAMGAMGLDFVFATEHASSSPQIIDADLPPYYLIPEIAHAQGDKLTEDDVRVTFGVLRDLDAERYAFCHGLIYGDKGANRETSLKGSGLRRTQNYLSYGVVPQIFLGGEVDAIPEVKISTIDNFQPTGDVQIGLPYGNGLVFDLSKLCSPKGCESPHSTLLQAEGDSYLVHDFQAVDSFNHFGREHLVYFPNSSALMVGDQSSFVASYTGTYGGATRRLDNLLPEFEQKGVVFVAHHLNGGNGTAGPNGVPWTTDHMLLKAFRSPAVLGLEFWNEDTRFKSRVCSHDFCRNNGDGSSYLGEELGFERHEELTAGSFELWEQFLLFLGNILGGDFLPAEYHNIALPLEEVRRGFISGGGDGGLFALKPFDVPSGLWQSYSYDTEHTLYHGSYDWDMLNLRGLDFEANRDLTWLQPGEPRRVFMGGGSDAHGDLNYRRAGYFLGAEDANDTAIGKPRNLVFVGAPEGPALAEDAPPLDPDSVNGGSGVIQPPVINPPIVEPPPLKLARIVDPPIVEPPPFEPPPPPLVKPPPIVDPPVVAQPIRPHTQEQIIRALRTGKFCVTDGPAIRIAIDMNGNNQIDDTDIQMGDVYEFKKLPRPRNELLPGQRLTLLIECISTPEFGAINKIDIYVGVHPGPVTAGTGEARIYAPFYHGTRDQSRDIDGGATAGGYTSGGRQYTRLRDGYWLGPNLGQHLTQRPPTVHEYAFTAVTTLDLDWYEAGQGISADRFFVRAFASTIGDFFAEKPNRYAYSNPIWLLRSELSSVLPPAIVEPPGSAVPVTSKAPSGMSGAAGASRNEQGQVVITFDGTLQFSPGLGEAFQDVPEARSPFVIPPGGSTGFYRARQ